MSIKTVVVTRLAFIVVLAFAMFFSFVSLTQVAENVFAAATITVDTVAESAADGDCSLREALINANNDDQSGSTDCVAGNGVDTIEFAIGVGGPHTISPTSDLPSITDDIIIDGYTETGANENSNPITAAFNGDIMIEIDLAGATNCWDFSATSTIRGLAITNSPDDGICLASGSEDSVVAGNFIGVDPDGITDEGNGEHGILANAGNITVGGTDNADRNVISGNDDATGAGLCFCGGTDSVVQGNFFGTAADGTTDLGNTNSGIHVNSSTNAVIGGTTTAARNVIAGNGSNGIGIGGSADSSGATVLGNYIGVDRTGMSDLGNDAAGVSVGDNSNNTTIGGTTSGARNIISGNGNAGVNLQSSSDNSTVLGNYIGLGSDGLTDIGNSQQGINVSSDTQTIGGAASGAGNVIAGNSLNGIFLSGDDSVVQGNYLGVSADGLSPVANGGGSAAGLSISGDNNTVGGTSAAERNIISSTPSNGGVAILGGSGNVIQGNYIGVDANGDATAGFDNDNGGIMLLSLNAAVTDNVIGGTAEGAANLIRGNGAGIIVLEYNDVSVINNSILGNNIYENSGGPITTLGIDLTETPIDFSSFPNVGVTANDANDADTGTNDYLNFPELNSTSATPGSLNVNFDLDVDGTAPNGYRVEFFANSTADASGNGEGEIYLGSTNVAGDVTGETATLTIPTSFTTGSYSITATATERDNSTDTFGATSEFAENLDDQTITAASAESDDDPADSSDSSDQQDSRLADSGMDAQIVFLLGIILVASGLGCGFAAQYSRHSAN